MGIVLATAGGMGLWAGIKAEQVSDLVRPELTDEGLAQHRKDFETARDVFNELDEDVLPALADSLGIPRDRFRGEIDAQYPAVGGLLAQKQQILPFAEQALVNLERQQNRFQRADSLPVQWLPGYALATVDLVLAAVVLSAATALFRPGTRRLERAAFTLLLGCCLVLIGLPLGLEIPAKAESAQKVLDSLNPSKGVVARTETSFAAGQAATGELDQRLIPDLAAAFGMTRPEFEAALAESFPGTAAGLDEMPAVVSRYEARVAIRSGGAPDLRTMKRLPIGVLGWFDPAFGALLLMAIGWAFVASRSLPAGVSVAGQSIDAGVQDAR